MYVINPIIFYLINLAQNVRNVCFIVTVIALFLSVAIASEVYVETCFDDEEEKKAKKIVKLLIIIAIVTGFLTIVLPSKETSYQMLVASQITDKNIEIAESTIKDSVDYIFEKLGK